MDIFIKVAQFIACLSLLVLLHEFGHFLFAKLFKVRVEKFYMFFNPWFSLFKFKKGETEYGIGWLPLGGYVKIAGMIDESMDTEQMKQPAQSWEFRSKPAWQRLLIMIGGVLVNIIVAFLIYIGIAFTWGENYLPAKNVKDGFTFDQTLKDYGFKNGDIIVAFDDQEIQRFDDIIPTLLLNNPQYANVIRDDSSFTIPIPKELVSELLALSSRSYKMNPLILPRIRTDVVEIQDFPENSVSKESGMQKGDKIIAINDTVFSFYDQFTELLTHNKNNTISTTVLRGSDTLSIPVQLGANGLLEIHVVSPKIDLEYVTQKYSFFQSIGKGIDTGFQQIGSYIKQLKMLFTHKEEAYKSVGGMVSIANIFPSHWSWYTFWQLTAIISIMLAVVNILPIPALDGGHVLFLLYEVITRHKPSEKFMEVAQMIGMFIILGLFILANVNDVLKFFVN